MKNFKIKHGLGVGREFLIFALDEVDLFCNIIFFDCLILNNIIATM